MWCLGLLLWRCQHKARWQLHRLSRQGCHPRRQNHLHAPLEGYHLAWRCTTALLHHRQGLRRQHLLWGRCLQRHLTDYRLLLLLQLGCCLLLLLQRRRQLLLLLLLLLQEAAL